MCLIVAAALRAQRPHAVTARRRRGRMRAPGPVPAAPHRPHRPLRRHLRPPGARDARMEVL
jgi:hypothetical protein